MKHAWVAAFVAAWGLFAQAHAQDVVVVPPIGGPPLPANPWPADPADAAPATASSSSSNSTNVDVNMNVNAPAAASAPAPVAASASNETNVTVNGVAASASADAAEADDVEATETHFLHGFRLGYLYIFATDTAVSPENMQPYGERYGIRSPHSFMLGYELAWRFVGHDWLNLLLIGNIMIAGLEQSRVFPSGNLLLGFELAEMAQIGIGVSLTPTKDDPAHMIFAAGWTPRVGSFYVPVHFFFVPDINGHHKLGATVGVNFG